MLKYSIVSIKNSITTKLLMTVFTIYLLVTILLTIIHVSAMYYETKNAIFQDMQSFQQVFGSVISQSVWDGDEKKIQTLATALQQVSFLTGIVINADMIGDISAGHVFESIESSSDEDPMKLKQFSHKKEYLKNHTIVGDLIDTFSYQFPLIYKDVKGIVKIGSVTLFSNTYILFQRIKLDFIFIVVNSFIKTLALWFIFLLVGRFLLNRPLSKLSNGIANLDLNHLADFKLDIKTKGRNELKIIEEGFLFMVDNLKKARDKWFDMNQNLEKLIHERTNELELKTIDLQNILEEKKQLNIELQGHRDQLQLAHDTLEDQVAERTKKLNQSLKKLKETQDHMLQAEKMAALGSLVAGVAHEINTPLGIGVTEASYLSDITIDFKAVYQKNEMTQTAFEKYLDNSINTTGSILKNLNRASEIIRNFKDVAVDQMFEEKRLFNLKDYINEVLSSLHSHLKRTQHSIDINCPDELEILSYPGVFAQIITNLVMNSLIHGFEGITSGNIIFDLFIKENNLYFSYRDSGIGMDEKTRLSVFEPFYTTKRGRGGTGLGMHVVYNLVTQKLQGKITCRSIQDVETEFRIRVPYESKK